MNMKKLLPILVMVGGLFTACATPSTSLTEPSTSNPAPILEEPVSELTTPEDEATLPLEPGAKPDSEPEATVQLSSAFQELSRQLIEIDIGDTTALASLFKISEELDNPLGGSSLREEEVTELRTVLMEKLTDWVDTREDRLNLTGTDLWLTAPTEGENALLEGANERIEQFRK